MHMSWTTDPPSSFRTTTQVSDRKTMPVIQKGVAVDRPLLFPETRVALLPGTRLTGVARSLTHLQPLLSVLLLCYMYGRLKPVLWSVNVLDRRLISAKDALLIESGAPSADLFSVNDTLSSRYLLLRCIATQSAGYRFRLVVSWSKVHIHQAFGIASAGEPSFLCFRMFLTGRRTAVSVPVQIIHPKNLQLPSNSDCVLTVIRILSRILSGTGYRRNWLRVRIF